MTKLRTLVCMLLLFAAWQAMAAPKLIDSGEVRSEIVLPDNAMKTEQFAAAELQKHIAKSTGKNIPIVNESKVSAGKYPIWVGATGMAAKESLDGSKLPLSGWRLKTTDHGLFLLGNDSDEPITKSTAATGTLYAVYCFLEDQLKVRWLWPDDEDGTACPPTADVSAGNYDLTGEPAFDNVRIRKLPILWQRRVGRIRQIPVNYPDGKGGHAFTKWHQEYGQTHPEWFAHKEGEKLKPVNRASSMCVSNPEFHREIVRRWQAAREKHPELRFDINCCENDTAGACACARCLSWDGPDLKFSFLTPEKNKKNVGDRYARFYLEVWKLASQIDPEVRIRGYAYSNYVYAPTKVKLPRNVFVAMVPPSTGGFPRTPKMFQELHDNLQGWIDSGATLNYRPNIFGGYAMPENYVTQYYDEFQMMHKTGMREVDIDGPNKSFATQGPLLYVMGRLLARPFANLDELLDEYYSAFDRGTSQVRSYWEYWSKYSIDNARKFYDVPIRKNKLRFSSFFGFHYAFYAHDLFPKETFGPAREILQQAQNAVKDDPAASKRVAFLQAGLDHAELCADTCALFDDQTVSQAERLKAVNRVRAFRESSLPAWAADVDFFTSNGRNENVVWTFSDFDPDSMIELPLQWLLKTDPKNLGEAQNFFAVNADVSDWKPVQTDRHLEKQNITDYHNAWYRLKFTIPSKFKEHRAVLHLGAVDESCKVWVNGREAGAFKYDQAIDPDSWKKPLDFDITRFLIPDGENVVVVKVINEVGNGGLWRPSQIRFFTNDTRVTADSAYFDRYTPTLRGYEEYLFLEKDADGKSILKILGTGKSRFVDIKLPYQYPGNKTYDFSAELMLEGRSAGYFSAVLREKEMGGKNLKDHHLKLAKNQDWTILKKSIQTQPETRRLQVLLLAQGLNSGAIGRVRSFQVDQR